MFPAAQKTFKTKQKYSTNNNLGKRLHFFFDKNKTLSIIILASLILCLLSFTFLHLRRVQPNSNIRSLASHSKAILENKNPNFNVFFGERNTPDKQWVRFEAKASSENPFEESQKGFFGQILDTVRPKRVLGIELSLEQAGTEKVKTSTEFIENVEPKEGDNPYTSSQKPHVLNTDVVDGIDIEYQILEGLGLKEDIIIKDLDLYTKECEDITTCDLAFNEFVFNLKLDDGLILKRAWYTYKGKNTETYYFTDEKGNYIGHFLPSWAIDSNGVKTHHIDIKVEEEKGNLKVKVVIDNDWLFSEERIFPIRIDPTIVHDTEIDFGAGSFVNTEYITTKGLAISSRDSEIETDIIECVGGTISEDGDYIIHTFNSNGSFYCDGSIQADILIIGGGGGGGGRHGGGGGAGGYISTTASVPANTNYSIVVGLGGIAGTGANNSSAPGGRGGNSSAFGITAVGGGGGGSGYDYGPSTGGSGGGSARNPAGAAGTTGQGYNGGRDKDSTGYNGGGGGGAGGPGIDGYYNIAGNGGPGLSSSITGVAVIRGGGGGAGSWNGTQGSGGTGGGGNAGAAGQENTGGGGGGGIGSAAGGNGGSGIVIIRYPKTPNYQIEPTVECTGGTISKDGDYIIHTFNSNESFYCDGSIQVGVLIIGGGGGGGGRHGGGGGAGGYISATTSASADTNYSIVVGLGGIAGTGDNNSSGSGQNGGNSSAFGITAVGGGGGGSGYDYGPSTGGSGGGSARNPAGAAGTTGQGYNGGRDKDSTGYNGGGGGGAGGPGIDGYYNIAGNGGPGLSSSITGVAVIRGGGGGAGSWNGTQGSGGTGGGGNAGAAGQENTGGGGGGGIGSAAGGNGGSGIVIIRYKQKQSIPSYRSGHYISPNIDFESNATLESLSWTSEGVNTGDGEIPYNDDGLVAQWNFNNTSGTTLTNNAGSCGTSCNATLSNFSNTSGQDVAIGSGWTNIHRRWGNGALMFDGVDDYATLNSNSSLRPANNFSVEAWVKVSNNTDFNIIITHADNGGGDDGWTLRVADTGRAQFYATNLNGFSNQNIQSNTLIELNEWYYLVGVYDNSVLKIYVNGILDNTKIAQGDVRYEVTDYVTIGRRGGTASPNTQFFHGTIDVIRFSQRVLSPSEILSNYQAGNIEFQYRDSGNDGEWVGGSEEVIDNFENNSGWQSTNENTLQKDSTEYSIEGSYALKLGGGYNYNIDSNTVGYWTLDETGGNLAYIRDSSGNNNHGTPTGTTYTSGKIGGARSFNGSSDSITTGTSARPSNNFTVETWFTTNVTHEIDTESTSGAGGTSGQKYLFGAMNEGTNAGMGVSVGTNGISVYEHGDSYMPALAVYNGPVPVGWNHLAVTYINKTPRIYLNGKLVRTGLTSTKSNIYAPYHIGGGPYGNHSGDIDEVRISNIARTPEEIAESYRLGKDHYVNKTLSSSIDLTDRTMIPFWVASDRLGSNLEFTYGNSKYVNNQPDANTVGLWRLDEESGSGAYLLDSSGNNNHGTPTGTTYTSGKIGGARSFNGSIVTPSYITMLRPSGVNNVLTVSLWFKTASTARGVLVDFSDSQPFNTPNAHLPILLIQSDGKIRAEYWTGTLQDIITSSTIVNDGNWHHISFVGNTSSQSLYIDGRLEGTRSGTIDNSWWIYTSLGVGYDTVDRGSQVPNSWNTSYNGLIDEFHISNIARTPTEIRQAYEMGRRTHPIVVTFNANLKSTNLITGDDDLSFDITTDSIENIDKGEKIIIKENYNGTEYIAQGDIETINKSTGAITVSSWDSGSTSPHYGIHSIGFSTNATVFKWQKEYIDIRFPLPEDKNNISQLTFRKTTNEGTTFWTDDMKKAKYITDSSGSTFEEVKNIQEAQYKSIFTTWDKNVSSDFYLTSVTLDYNDNNPPTAPTDLLTQGQTNPIRVSTPYFSAIFNDPDTGDTGVKYQIQVNTTTDFSGALTWDSGIKTMTATSVGARSPNLTYAGTALPMDGTTYYWRIKFIDYGGLESPWSSTAQFTMNRPPTAPTDLLTQGQTNPIRISTPTPYFSAIFNDLDTGDTGVKYQIQVNTTGNFSGALIWDSGIKTMTATSVGARSPNITYAGAALPMDGTIYYWRIKFVDYGGLESLWSSIAQFTMNNSPSVPTDLLTQGQTNPLKVTTPTPYFSAIFNDPDTGDTGIKYQIQVNVQDNFQPISMIWDSGIKTMTATSVGARSPNITYAGTTLPMDGTKYYWRIKFIDNGGLESPWSSTISTDYFILSGIPTASDLQTDGMTNPTSVLKPPSFSAIYNDPNNDNSSYYQIQVNTTSNFLGTTMWDSGKKVITLSPGTRSPWIPYAGTNLNYNGTKYYVRMKFWDNDDNESTWVTGNFTDNPGKFQLEGLKLEGLKID